MKADSRTLTSQVHDAILEMVIDSGTESEEMLLTEGALVEKFGVSKAPVREALLRLCAEEVLRSIPRCGYVVVRLGEKSGRDNMIVREMLELSSLDRYFDAYTPEKLDAIAANLQLAREECARDSSVWNVWKHNMAFHCDLIAVAENPHLLKHLTNCIEVERRFYAQNQYTASKRFSIHFCPEAHEAILAAIRSGNKELAMRLLRTDITIGRLAQ